VKRLIKKLLVFFFSLLLNIFQDFFANKKEYILCFDCLYDVNQEQIDALVLFEYLQKNNIKSKYIALCGAQLDIKTKTDDVVFVKNKWEFLFKNFFLILSSRYIFTSFGLFDEIDFVLKKAKNFDYIFIEHGVIFNNSSVLDIYSSEKFNKILVPTKYTYDLYVKNNLWDKNKMILSGLPRWDRLKNHITDKSNKIFVFFTWRKCFLNNFKKATEYIEQIKIFLDYLSFNLPSDIKICYAWHHEVLKNKIQLPLLNQRVKLIGTNQISHAIYESDILITDYSSVFWDFYYQSKPVIFYDFNFKDICLNDDSKKLPFELFLGNLCNQETFLAKLKFYLENNFKFKNNEEKIIEKLFFPYEDNSKAICDKLNILN